MDRDMPPKLSLPLEKSEHPHSVQWLLCSIIDDVGLRCLSKLEKE